MVGAHQNLNDSRDMNTCPWDCLSSAG